MHSNTNTTFAKRMIDVAILRCQVYIKTNYFFLLFCLITFGEIYAQDEKAEGYFINLKGDTTNCMILIPLTWPSAELDIESLEKSFKYDSPGNMRTELMPKQIKEYSFKYKEVTYLMRSAFYCFLSDKLSNKDRNLFMRLRVDGKIKLYTYTNYTGAAPSYNGTNWVGGGVSNKSSQQILLKDNGDCLKVKKHGLKSRLKDFIPECSKVLDKINKDEYDLDDISFLVDDYNYWCK